MIWVLRINNTNFLNDLKCILYFPVTAVTMSGNEDYKSAKSVYDFVATNIKGEQVPLEK